MAEEESKIVKCVEEMINAKDIFEIYERLIVQIDQIHRQIEQTRSPTQKRSLVMKRTHLREEAKKLKHITDLAFKNFAVCECSESLPPEWDEPLIKQIKHLTKQTLKEYGYPTEVYKG